MVTTCRYERSTEGLHIEGSGITGPFQESVPTPIDSYAIQLRAGWTG